MNLHMRVDEVGFNFIKVMQRYSATPYKDAHDTWTIGYGHTVGVNASHSIVTRDQADALLREDIEETEEIVRNLVRVPLTQNEFNALVSFAFNFGAEPFKGTTLVKKLNEGDKRGASKEFERWVHLKNPEDGHLQRSSALTERRLNEKHLFLVDINNAVNRVDI